jgi:hypothetical protein
LEDTRQDSVTCKYCGFVFKRDDVVQEDEEYIRRKMVVDLRSKMDMFKARKRFSIIFMSTYFVLALPLLFLKTKDLTMPVVLLILFILIGFGFFLLMIVFDRMYDSNKSKASDISMRRRL